MRATAIRRSSFTGNLAGKGGSPNGAGGAGGAIAIQVGSDSPFDIVRDVAAEMGVGLLRVARRRDRLEDLFHVDDAVIAGGMHG